MLHRALYGNVGIDRTYCRACRSWTLILKGKRACCGLPGPEKPEVARRISQPPQIRHAPPPKIRMQILAEQGHQCLYCDRAFGEWALWRGKLIRLRLVWDHLMPWSHQWNNDRNNFAACCHICNGVKSNLIFATVDEVRAHVQKTWQARSA